MKPKILIVEDDKDAFVTFNGLLGHFKENYELINNENFLGKGNFVVKSQHELKMLLTDSKPDVVLTDISLGSFNAFQVIEELKHINFWVIFVTGQKDKGYGLKAWEVSQNGSRDILTKVDFYHKPFTIMDLQIALRKYESEKSDLQRLPIPGPFEFYRPAINQIIKLESDKNGVRYMYLHQQGRLEKKPVSPSISQLARELPPDFFCKINQNCIINKAYVSSTFGNCHNARVILEHIDYSKAPPSERGEKVTYPYYKDFKEWLGQ